VNGGVSTGRTRGPTSCPGSRPASWPPVALVPGK
jgi:hypothetical protein